MCDLDNRCKNYKQGCDDFDNITDGKPVCFGEDSLREEQAHSSVSSSAGLGRLLKEMKEETKEYLKDYIHNYSDDLDRLTSELIMARLEDFFDRKICDIERSA